MDNTNKYVIRVFCVDQKMYTSDILEFTDEDAAKTNSSLQKLSGVLTFPIDNGKEANFIVPNILYVYIERIIETPAPSLNGEEPVV